MMWPRAAALAYRCWGAEESFDAYFAARLPLLQRLGITIRDENPLQRVNIAHLGIGGFHQGFPTSLMMQTLEKSAIAGEVAKNF